jgi:hypothetical protein
MVNPPTTQVSKFQPLPRMERFLIFGAVKCIYERTLYPDRLHLKHYRSVQCTKSGIEGLIPKNRFFCTMSKCYNSQHTKNVCTYRVKDSPGVNCRVEK